jgi:hypothetical protein
MISYQNFYYFCNFIGIFECGKLYSFATFCFVFISLLLDNPAEILPAKPQILFAGLLPTPILPAPVICQQAVMPNPDPIMVAWLQHQIRRGSIYR